jgi:hypothetical protein
MDGINSSLSNYQPGSQWYKKSTEPLPLPNAGKELVAEITDGLSAVLFSAFGCSNPPQSCITTGGSPTMGGVVINPPNNYDYTDPNRGPVTWTFSDSANCDKTGDGVSVTVAFPDGPVTVPFQKNASGRWVAVVSKVLADGVSGPFPVTITSKNGKTITGSVYGPAAKAAAPVVNDACVYNHGTPTVSGGLEMSPAQPIAGEPVTFTYKKHNIILCDGKTYGDDPASLATGYITDPTNETADQARDASSDRSGLISRSMTFPKGQVANVYVVVTDGAHPEGVPQMVGTGSFYVKEAGTTTTCQNSGQSAALTASASAGSIVRGDNTLVTYTATNVRDNCGQAVNINYAKLDQLFLPGYSHNYDVNSKTLTVAGVIRDDVSLPSPVEIPLTDGAGNVVGAIDFYPPVRTTPEIVIPTDAVYAGTSFQIKIGKPASGASVKVTVTDKLDGGSVISSFTGESGILTVPQSGNYYVKATVTPAGDKPYDLEPASITVYPPKNSCQNSGQPVSPTAVASINVITRGTSEPVTFTAEGIHDNCNQPVKIDYAKLDQIFLSYTKNYDTSNMTLTVTGIIKDTLPLPGVVELPLTDASGAAAGSIKFYPPTVNLPKITVPTTPVHNGDNFTVSVTPEMADADAVITLTDVNGQPLADPVEAFSANFTASQSGTFKIKAVITPKNGDLPYEISGEIVVYDASCANNSQLGTFSASRSDETIIRGTSKKVTYIATAVHDTCNQPVVFDSTKVNSKLDELFLSGYTFNYNQSSMTVTVTGMIKDSASLPNPLEIPFTDQAGKATGAVNLYPPTRTTPAIIAPPDGSIHENEAFTVSTSPLIGDSDADVVLKGFNASDPGKTALASVKSAKGEFTLPKSGNYTIGGTVTPKNGDTPYELNEVNIIVYGKTGNTCQPKNPLDRLTATRTTADTILRGTKSPFTYTVTAVHDNCNQPVDIDYANLDQLFLHDTIQTNYDVSSLTLTVTGVVKDSPSLPSPVEIPYKAKNSPDTAADAGAGLDGGTAAAVSGVIQFYPPERTTPVIKAPADAIYANQAFEISTAPEINPNDADVVLNVVDASKAVVATVNSAKGQVIVPKSGNYTITGTVTPKNGDASYNLKEVPVTAYDTTCQNNGQLISRTAMRSTDTIVRGENTLVTYTASDVRDFCNQPVMIDYTKLAQLFVPGYAAPVYDGASKTLTASGTIKAAQLLPSPVVLPFKDQAGAEAGSIELFPPTRKMPVITPPTTPIYIGQPFQLSLVPTAAGATPFISITDRATNEELTSFSDLATNIILPFTGIFKASGSLTPQGDEPFALDPVFLSPYDPTCQNNGQLVRRTAARSADTIVRGENTLVTFTANDVRDFCDKPVTIDYTNLTQLFVPGYAAPVYDGASKTLIASGTIKAAQLLPSPIVLPFKDQAGADAGSIELYPPTRKMPVITLPTSAIYAGTPFLLQILPAVAGATVSGSVTNQAGATVATLSGFSANVTLPSIGQYKAAGRIAPQNDNPFDLDQVNFSTYGLPPVFESFIISPNGCTREAGHTGEIVNTCPSPFIVNFKLKASSSLGLAGIKINFGNAPEVTYDPAAIFNAAENAYLFTHEYATANAAVYQVTGSVSDSLSQSTPIPVGNTVSVY